MFPISYQQATNGLCEQLRNQLNGNPLPHNADVPSVAFDNATDEQVLAFLESQSLDRRLCRKLDDGEWICLMPLTFSVSVCMGISPTSTFKYRWCFNVPYFAVLFFLTATAFDDVPDELMKSFLVGHRYTDKPLYVAYDKQGHAKW